MYVSQWQRGPSDVGFALRDEKKFTVGPVSNSIENRGRYYR